MKLSDYVLMRIAQQGVTHVFLVPGGGAMHLNDSLGRQEGVTFVANLHEQASAIAADAYARVTGKLGVCMVTTGPGATNAITGLTSAWLDSIPCLFLSGQVKRPDIKTGTGLRQLGNQEIGIVDLVSSVTKYAVTITDPNSIRYHLDKALHLAYSGRPGPVWLDIPLDVQAATIDPEALESYTPPAEEVARPDLLATARATWELLIKAERPLLFLGNGIRVAGAAGLVDRLVETLGIPVQTTWLALDLIPESHPLFVPRPGAIAPRSANFTLQNSDFLLSIGARLDMATTGYAHDRFARAARKVICDIDPAELAKLNMAIDLKVVADAKAFIEALIAVAPEFTKPECSAWQTRIRDWKARYPLTAPESSKHGAQLSMYEAARALSDAIPENTLIAPGSSGFASEIFHLMLQIKPGQRCYHSRGTGSMGFALPSAIGACFAHGQQPVVSMDGDGGFQFNIQELAVMAAHRLPIAMFVFNNGGYASIRASQNGYFGGNLVASDATSGLVLPDLQKVAEAYGVRYDVIRKGDDVAAKIRAALALKAPIVVEIEVIPDEPREPRLASMKREDGSMVSKPLEDLFPFLPREEFRANMLIPTIEE